MFSRSGICHFNFLYFTESVTLNTESVTLNTSRHSICRIWIQSGVCGNPDLILAGWGEKSEIHPVIGGLGSLWAIATGSIFSLAGLHPPPQKKGSSGSPVLNKWTLVVCSKEIFMCGKLPAEPHPRTIKWHDLSLSFGYRCMDYICTPQPCIIPTIAQ